METPRCCPSFPFSPIQSGGEQLTRRPPPTAAAVPSGKGERENCKKAAELDFRPHEPVKTPSELGSTEALFRLSSLAERCDHGEPRVQEEEEGEGPCYRPGQGGSRPQELPRPPQAIPEEGELSPQRQEVTPIVGARLACYLVGHMAPPAQTELGYRATTVAHNSSARRNARDSFRSALLPHYCGQNYF